MDDNVNVELEKWKTYFLKYKGSYEKLKNEIDSASNKSGVESKYVFVELNLEYRNGKWDYSVGNPYQYNCIMSNNASGLIVGDLSNVLLREDIQTYLKKIGEADKVKQRGGQSDEDGKDSGLPSVPETNVIMPPAPPSTEVDTKPLTEVDTKPLDDVDTKPLDVVVPTRQITLVFQLEKNDPRFGYQINPTLTNTGYYISKFSCNIMNGIEFNSIFNGTHSDEELKFKKDNTLRANPTSFFDIPQRWKGFNMQKYNEFIDSSKLSKKDTNIFNIIFYRLFYNLGKEFNYNPRQLHITVYNNQKKDLFTMLCFDKYGIIPTGINAQPSRTDGKKEEIIQVSVGPGKMETECTTKYQSERKSFYEKELENFKTGNVLSNTGFIGSKQHIYQEICFYLLKNEEYLTKKQLGGRLLFYLDMYKNFCIFMALMGSFFRLRFFQFLIKPDLKERLSKTNVVDVFIECLLKTCNEILFNRNSQSRNEYSVESIKDQTKFVNLIDKYPANNEFLNYIKTVNTTTLYKYYKDKHEKIAKKDSTDAVKNLNQCVYKEITNLVGIDDIINSLFIPFMCHISNFQFLIQEIVPSKPHLVAPPEKTRNRKGGLGKFTRKMIGSSNTNYDENLKNYFVFTCLREYYNDEYKNPDKGFGKKWMELFCQQSNLAAKIDHLYNSNKGFLPQNKDFSISSFDVLKSYYDNFTLNAVKLDFHFTEKGDSMKINAAACGLEGKLEEMIKYFYLNGYTYYAICRDDSPVIDKTLGFPLLERALETLIPDKTTRESIIEKYNLYNNVKIRVNKKMIDLYSLFGYLNIESGKFSKNETPPLKLFKNIDNVVRNIQGKDFKVGYVLSEPYMGKDILHREYFDKVYSQFLVCLLYLYITKTICEILREFMDAGINTDNVSYELEYSQEINLRIWLFMHYYYTWIIAHKNEYPDSGSKFYESIERFSILSNKLCYTGRDGGPMTFEDYETYYPDIFNDFNAKHNVLTKVKSADALVLESLKVNDGTSYGTVFDKFFKVGFSYINYAAIDINYLKEATVISIREITNRNQFEMQTNLLTFLRKIYENYDFIGDAVNPQDKPKVVNIFSNMDVARKYIYKYAKQILDVEYTTANIKTSDLFLRDSSMVHSVLVPIRNKLTEKYGNTNTEEYFLIVDELEKLYNSECNTGGSKRNLKDIDVKFVDSTELIAFENIIVANPDVATPIKPSDKTTIKPSDKTTIKQKIHVPYKGGKRRTRRKRPTSSFPTA